MQRRYGRDQFATRVWIEVEEFARPVGCQLWETLHSNDSFAEGKQARYDVNKLPDKKHIRHLAVAREPDGTYLTITDEPHSYRHGHDFEHEASVAFGRSLLASLPGKWRIQQVT